MISSMSIMIPVTSARLSGSVKLKFSSHISYIRKIRCKNSAPIISPCERFQSSSTHLRAQHHFSTVLTTNAREKVHGSDRIAYRAFATVMQHLSLFSHSGVQFSGGIRPMRVDRRKYAKPTKARLYRGLQIESSSRYESSRPFGKCDYGNK